MIVGRFAADKATYTIHVDENRKATISAEGLVLVLHPQSAELELREPDDDDLDTFIYATADEFLDRFDERDRFEDRGLKPELLPALKWHRGLARAIIETQSRSLFRAILSGAAHVMARKSNVLSNFERVLPDQYQYFRVDRLKEVEGGGDGRWFAPDFVDIYGENLASSTATGPSDQKLYSIYVAPGEPTERSGDAHEKCMQWVRELLKENPSKCRFTKDRLRKEAQNRYPSLSIRATNLIFAKVAPPNWFPVGRPRKSVQEIKAK